MNRLFSLLSSAALLFVAPTAGLCAAPPRPAAKVIEVDVDNLPASLNVRVGDTVVFKRSVNRTGSSVFVRHGVGHSFADRVFAAVVHKGFVTTAVFQAVHKGQGQFWVQFAITSPHGTRALKRLPYSVR